jgi:SAM-dependent methyltransferase
MEYIGEELILVKNVNNWKKYWGDRIAPFLGGNVLEVGAGIGSNMLQLIERDSVKKWVCIEPDKKLAAQIEYTGKLDRNLVVEACVLNDYKVNEKFDSILYIDVIEHIEDAEKELELALTYLKPGGHLIILVPAYNFLFNEFDKAIGHFRRYNKKMLKASVPKSLQQKKLFYLDSMGFFASLVNKLFLHQAYPSEKQIKFWDTTIVTMSKFTDVLTFNSMGKSLIGIWKKE